MSINTRVMKRPLVVEECRLNFTDEDSVCNDSQEENICTDSENIEKEQVLK